MTREPLTPAERLAIQIINTNEDADPREIARLIDEAISLDNRSDAE